MRALEAQTFFDIDAYIKFKIYFALFFLFFLYSFYILSIFFLKYSFYIFFLYILFILFSVILSQQDTPLTTCAQIAVYLQEEGSLRRDASSDLDMFNPDERSPVYTPLYTSNQCCMGDHSRCVMHLNLTKSFVAEAKENWERRRRRLVGGNEDTVGTQGEPRFIVSYECIGPGKDLCDTGSLEPSSSRTVVQSRGTKEGEGGAGGVACCRALTLSCVACSRGQTEQEFCAANKEDQLCVTTTTTTTTTMEIAPSSVALGLDALESTAATRATLERMTIFVALFGSVVVVASFH